MSYRMRRYECPDCSRDFTHLHTVTDGVEEPPPQYCPLCGSYVGDEAPSLPSKISIATNESKSGDAVYRAMEDSSAYRAEMAAQVAGVDVSEMSHMKITDMKDNMRAGDIAAMTPPNPVSQALAQTGGMTGFSRGGISAENQKYIADAQRGPYVGAGNAARENVVGLHQRTAAQVVNAGRINK